eukprot:TRINITY_DN19538_c0_g1_i1.p1 TRINITY_DN19538_c0_g1~~TRINITY_DN19538_c0_g1_i1.p1  ORF type:complete len:606 (+),score=188.49 TRINITY_DN19538_c0_g1_i1:168-1985(+)
MFDIAAITSDNFDAPVTIQPTRTKSSGKERSIYNTYDFLEELGKGSYGVVSRVRNIDSGLDFACKHIDKRAAGSKGLREVFSEVEILSLLRHPSVVRLEEIYEDQNSLWLVMDLVEGGELEHELKKQGGTFRESVTRRIMRHILLAVEYIHGKGIVHRDLKLANMLVSGRFEEGGNCEVKLADFGFSCVVSHESTLTSFCGTTVFMAPEILLDKPYGKPVDMWALGVICYVMLYGALPFTGTNETDLVNRICAGVFEYRDALAKAPLSKSCKDFVSRLLLVDSAARMTAQEALHHPWIQQDSAFGMLDCELDADETDFDVATSFLRKSPKSRARKIFWVIRAAHRFIYFARHAALEPEDLEIPLLKDFSYLVASPFRYEPPRGVLSASGCPLPNRVVQRLCDRVEAARKIDTFDLSHTNLSYDGLQMVTKAVSMNPRVTTLDVSGNQISSSGARAVLRLARSSKLKTIHLKGTGVGGDILTQIEGVLRDAQRCHKNKTQAPRSRGPESNTFGSYGSGSSGLSSLNGVASSSKTTGTGLGKSSGAPMRRTTPPVGQRQSVSTSSSSTLPTLPRLANTPNSLMSGDGSAHGARRASPRPSGGRIGAR